MKVAVFSSKSYDKQYLIRANQNLALSFFEARLNQQTAQLAKGFDAVCVFVNDELDAQVLSQLHQFEVKHIALRCAGFNNLDLDKAQELGMTVSRVPAYSPEAVAEHTLALMLSLSRKTHKAYHRVREGNFALEGLLGFNLSGKTIGVIGAGRIGLALCKILSGFDCKVLCSDPSPSPEIDKLNVSLVPLKTLIQTSNIISLHCPLTPDTRHIINQQNIDKMMPGVMLINTSRGALVDTKAVIQGLKAAKIGHLGLDVYEMEGDLFFEHLSNQIIQDDVFQRLSTFPNVLITGHQGFFTHEAMEQIAQTTINNLQLVARGQRDSGTFLVN